MRSEASLKATIIAFFVLAFQICVVVRAADSPELIARALKRHDRAVHLLDDWMRDPYIILAPTDGTT